MAKMCVTGAAGFIGGHLAEALLRDGHEVVGLDDFSSGKRENAALLAKFPKFTLVEGSIADPGAARRAIEGATWVFHLAAIPSVPRSIHDPAPSHEVNIDGTFNVLRAAAEGKVGRVVYAASSSLISFFFRALRYPVFCCQYRFRAGYTPSFSWWDLSWQ